MKHLPPYGSLVKFLPMGGLMVLLGLAAGYWPAIQREWTASLPALSETLTAFLKAARDNPVVDALIAAGRRSACSRSTS